MNIDNTVQKGTYLAISFSIVIHGIIFLLVFITQPNQQKSVKKISKSPPIKSFIYYAPNASKAPKQVTKQTTKQNLLEKPNNGQNEIVEHKAVITDKPEIDSSNKNSDDLTDKTIDKAVAQPILSKANVRTKTSNTIVDSTASRPEPKPSPVPVPAPKNKKLDSFTQLQRLRSKLNNRSGVDVDNPYQREQPPSIFNPTVKAVPHSAPLKDEEKIRKKNTKNMGAGIAITKGEDGRCSVTQDLSVYGLSEGSSTQFFNCGETKFDQSFREHMKAVKAKLGKK